MSSSRLIDRRLSHLRDHKLPVLLGKQIYLKLYGQWTLILSISSDPLHKSQAYTTIQLQTLIYHLRINIEVDCAMPDDNQAK